ncbi:MAG: hypothetical protein KC912_10930 [Proteobacteria bacterium]|nr:hypothetical protein [Pseudomonadota bacterium]
MRLIAPLVALSLVACKSDYDLTRAEDLIELAVTSPEYGEFLGDGPILVRGTISPPHAVVFVEGERVEHDNSGTFETELPLDYAYKIVDVEAEFYGARERVRVPVFDRHDPMDTFPGGLSARVTDAGLATVGDGLGPMIDGLGWQDMLLGIVPPIDTSLFSATPVGLTHAPSAIVIDGVPGGLDVGVALREVTILMDLSIAGAAPVPMELTYDEIRITLFAVPRVDADGMLFLELGEPAIELGEPTVTVDGASSLIMGFLLTAVSDGLGGLSGGLGGLLGGALGEIPLGGPYAFDFDLLGLPVGLRLSDAGGDPEGALLGLGLGLGEPAPTVFDVPYGSDLDPDTHAVIGLHEAPLHLAVTGGLLDMLDQDLELGGVFGDLIGNGIESIPGGDDAPEGDGWCLNISPQPAEVVRLQAGTAPLGVVYLPDVLIDVGRQQGSDCEPWLLASLAFELELEVERGTQIGLDLKITDGAVLDYKTTDDWDEAEVVEGLGGFIESSTGLLLGQFEFDLADLAGGLGGGGGLGGLGDSLPPLELSIRDSQPLLDDQGNHPEGLFAISLGLFGTSEP